MVVFLYRILYSTGYFGLIFSSMDFFATDGSVMKYSPIVSDDYKHLFYVETQSSAMDGSTTSTIHASNTMHNLVKDGGSTALAIDDGVSAEADIEKFLSRKVQIATYQWGVGGDLAQNFNPWDSYLANAAVSNKLQNYQLLKGDLKLTFYINGTPFHQGMVLASYSYLNVTNEIFTGGGDTQLVTRSQRPHLYLNPSTGKGGCMCLPFFLPTNYLSLTDPLFDADSIGKVHLDSFAPLVQINSGTDTVTITVFAEMLNVKLTGPTMRAVALAGPTDCDFSIFDIETQASSTKDEYDDSGVISGPASAVAEIAGRLTDVPVIGSFALATQMGATAIGGIAKLFGYSKPIQVADISPMRNFPVSSLALTEGADTSQKLTVTGKAELSIDPLLMEMENDDLLSIKSLTSRESYVTQFNWGVADTVGTTLFAMDVDPMAERRTAVPGGTQIIPTSLSFASRPFSAWSGTLKYRFQVIASQYHRGRISIIYDPTGPLTGDPYNTTFNTIADLSEARDFTVEFKWQQDRGYCFITTANSRTFYTETTPASRTSTRDTCNGIFYVRVVNELVVPDGATGVKVLVSISAGDDFELVNPKGSTLQVFPFAPIAQSGNSEEFFGIFEIEAQSAVEVVPVSENAPEQEQKTLTLTSGVVSHPVEKPLIYYGERVTSFRQLLKRYCFFRTAFVPSGSTDSYLCHYYWRQMPAVGGFDPNGPDVTAGLNPYTYVGNNYINYIKGAFAGWKGSIRWKFVPMRTQVQLAASRDTGNSQRATAVDYRRHGTAAFNAATSIDFAAYSRLAPFEMTGGGAALTQCRTMDALEVEIPYTTNMRFSKVEGDYLKVNTNTLPNGYPGGDTFVVSVMSADNSSSTLLDTYVAAGEDFSLFGWVGAPVVYSATTPPAT